MYKIFLVKLVHTGNSLPDVSHTFLFQSSLQFRANSMNVSYTVSIIREFTKKKETVCVTDQQHCSFQIHAKVRKVYLTAMNEAGKSNPTEVPVYRRRGRDNIQTKSSLSISIHIIMMKANLYNQACMIFRDGSCPFSENIFTY